MDPLSSNDPLHELLGKSRKVQVRPNFTQDVMRAIRQEPQSRSFWERVQEYFQTFASPQRVCLTAVAVLAVTAFSINALRPQNAGQTSSPIVAEVQTPAATETLPAEVLEPTDEASLETVVSSDLNDMDQLSILLAQQDTSSLTDSEIAVLLY